MTDTKTSAQTLRDAAALMRERAQAATPGPYIVSDSNEGMWPPRPAWEIANDAFYNPPADEDEPWIAVEFHTGIEADALYLGSWHPAVALAVADWLDADAKFAEESPFYADLDSEEERAEFLSNPLAVANAYLRETR